VQIQAAAEVRTVEVDTERRRQHPDGTVDRHPEMTDSYRRQ
jgi:hypothetical protein